MRYERILEMKLEIMKRELELLKTRLPTTDSAFDDRLHSKREYMELSIENVLGELGIMIDQRSNDAA